MRQVQNKIKAIIKEDVISEKLKDRGWTYNNLLDKLQEEYGIDIGYKSFAKLLKNKSAWQLTYALVLCDFFKVEMRELFELIQVSP